MVAMNAETYTRDVREVASGGYLIYDATWARSALLQRADITVIGVPLARLVNENFDGVRNRILLKNIAYAGALAALLNVDLEIITFIGESYGRNRSCWSRTRERCVWVTTTPRSSSAARCRCALHTWIRRAVIS